MIGETIGKYRVDDFIGAGGMGEIWLATDTGLNRLVALKVLPPQLVSHPDRRARLVREARLVAALAHPHIATIYEILEDQDRLMLAMEYVCGWNRPRPSPAVSPSRARRLAEAVCGWEPPGRRRRLGRGGLVVAPAGEPVFPARPGDGPDEIAPLVPGGPVVSGALSRRQTAVTCEGSFPVMVSIPSSTPWPGRRTAEISESSGAAAETPERSGSFR